MFRIIFPLTLILNSIILIIYLFVFFKIIIQWFYRITHFAQYYILIIITYYPRFVSMELHITKYIYEISKIFKNTENQQKD